jgi:hypothetical protein
MGFCPFELFAADDRLSGFGQAGVLGELQASGSRARSSGRFSFRAAASAGKSSGRVMRIGLVSTDEGNARRRRDFAMIADYSTDSRASNTMKRACDYGVWDAGLGASPTQWCSLARTSNTALRPNADVPRGVVSKTRVCGVAWLAPIDIGSAPRALHPSRLGHNARVFHHVRGSNS